MVLFTPAHQTRQRQDRLVVSGVLSLSCLVRRRELGIRVGGVSAVCQSRTAAVGGRGDMRTAVLIVLSR